VAKRAKKTLRVVAFNGSPRKDGNTALLLRTVLSELEAEGVETELVQVGGKKIRGCTACFKCFASKDQHCAVKTDLLNDCLDKMLAADGILFGSPTYFANVTTELKALIDRAGLVAMANEGMLRRKVGAAVVAVRRAGASHVFQAVNQLFLAVEMIVPGANYPNLAVGLDKGDVAKDPEGMQTMRVLGKNMAWLLQRVGA
jgi:multimeric flavodoxin WrbA